MEEAAADSPAETVSAARQNATTLLKRIQYELEQEAAHYEELARISRRRLEYLNRSLSLAAGLLQPTELISKESLAATQATGKMAIPPPPPEAAQMTPPKRSKKADDDADDDEDDEEANAEAEENARKNTIKKRRGESDGEDDEEEDELIPGGSGSLARELNQRMRGFAMGAEFLNDVLREEAILSVGVLQELLKTFF